MDFNTAVEQLRQLDPKPYLRRSAHSSGNSGYICPHCHSGTNGNHNTGAVKYYPQTRTASCHACRKKVDAIDLYQDERGITDFVEAVKALAAEQGMIIEDNTGSSWRRSAPEDFAPADPAEVEELEPAQATAETGTSLL